MLWSVDACGMRRRVFARPLAHFARRARLAALSNFSFRCTDKSMGDQAGATLQNYNSDLVAVRCSGCMSALATLVGRAICRRAGVYPRTTHTRAAFVRGSA